mgnify:CR=1 FL=1
MTRIFRDFWDSSLTARLTRRVLVIVAATFLLLLAILTQQSNPVADCSRGH